MFRKIRYKNFSAYINLQLRYSVSSLKNPIFGFKTWTSPITIQSCQSCYSYVRGVEYNDDFFRHLTNGFIFGVQAILHWSFFGSARGNKIQGDPEISAKVSNNLREIALSFFCIVGRGLRHGVKLHCQRARICVILSLVPVPHSEWGNFFTPVP